jgi:hypothetical protein
LTRAPRRRYAVVTTTGQLRRGRTYDRAARDILLEVED